MPKISIIIPTYNREKYIAEAINSVLSQTFKDYEIIVVDDGSTDNTRELLSKYNGTIKYYHKNNGGEGSARNLGLDKATGQYIAFLDSDDVWYPELLSDELRYLEENDFDIIYSKMVLKNANGDILGYKPSRKQENSFDWFMKYMGHMPASTILVKKECFDKVGYFDESLQVLADYDMWLRISRYYKVGYLDKVLADYRKHSDNLTNKLYLFNEAEIQISKKYLKDPEIYNKYKEVLIIRLTKNSYALGKFFHLNKSYSRAAKLVFASLKYNLFLGSLFWETDDNFFKKVFKLIKPYGLLFVSSMLFFMKNKHNKNIINVLYYEPTTGYGGSSRCLLAWLKKLNKEKYNPIVVVCQNGPAIRKIYELGVDIFRMPYKPLTHTNYVPLFSQFKFLFNFLIFDIPMSLLLCILIKKHQVKIIHLNAKVIAVTPGIIASKLTNVPCICHLHDTQVPTTKRERFFGQFVNYYVVLTEKAKELYGKIYPNKRIELVYNGIDLTEFYSKSDIIPIKESLNIKSEDRVIGMVGRLVTGKGFSDFIRAAKLISEKKSGVSFLIVGSAPKEYCQYENSLKRLVKELELEKKVVFTGWRENIKGIMSTFDVLVQASSTFREGFGLTCIEAMALGKPVVATDVPGPSEVILNGITGFVVPSANPEKLAEAILIFLNNPELARNFGRAGRKRVEEAFEISKVTKEIENLYLEVLNQRR